VEDFSKKFYPAYLSNGLIGIRPGSSPLAAATTMVNGFVCPNSTHGDVSLSPAPYPLATDFRVNDVSLLKHPELTKIQRQTLDMAKGELLTEIVFTPASGVALRLTVLQFASRSVPSLLCQEITFSTSAEAHVELSAAIESAEFTGGVYSTRPPARTEVDLAIGYLSQGGISKLGVALAVPAASDFHRLGEQVTGRASFAAGFSLEARADQTYRFPTIAAMVSDFYQPAPEQEAIRLAKCGRCWGLTGCAARTRNRGATFGEAA